MAGQKGEANEQLWETLQYGLKKGEEKTKVDVLKTLLGRAAQETDEEAVDLETTIAFDYFLQKQKHRLFELAKTNPIDFDNFLKNLRANYCSVANKLLVAYNGGNSFPFRICQLETTQILSNMNTSFDLHAKQTELFETRWISLYDDIDASLQSFERSDNVDWSRIAVICRRHQLDDESGVEPSWKRRCPFKTQFGNAYKVYPLAEVMKMLGLNLNI